ncbi:hypothetical protein Syun_008847 [Stephania yunnanensis]|uniref:Uncharacterized protein n=1 Tax=Stephania yunnanensis TaxID=152371 RepID=A0AAP0KDE4_9MAGN
MAKRGRDKVEIPVECMRTADMSQPRWEMYGGINQRQICDNIQSVTILVVELGVGLEANRVKGCGGDGEERMIAREEVAKAIREEREEGGDGEAKNSEGGVDHLAYGEGDIEIFSVPDWAWAMTSRPLMMGMMTLYWMAESFSNP